MDSSRETFEEVLRDRNELMKVERAYQKRIKQLEDELKAMVRQCQEFSDENKKLQTELEKMEQNSKSRKNTENIDELKDLLRDVQLEKHKVMKENTKLLSRVKESEEKIKQNDTIFVENTKLKTKTVELDKQINSLNSDLEKERQEKRELEKNIKDLTSANETLSEEKQKLSSNVTSAQRDQKNTENELEETKIKLKEVMESTKENNKLELDLKQTQIKLEKIQLDLKDSKTKLSDVTDQFNDTEKQNEKLRQVVKDKDNEIKKLRGDQELKLKYISELKNSLDKSKDEIQNKERKLSGEKDLEKNNMALKSRINSLKSEIEGCILENKNLKRERENANKRIQSLEQANAVEADAFQENKKYFRKWETEKEARSNAENKLIEKEAAMRSLEAKLIEENNRIIEFRSRIKDYEENLQQKYGKITGPENAYMALERENKKLRKMLVERNIELTQKINEKNKELRMNDRNVGKKISPTDQRQDNRVRPNVRYTEDNKPFVLNEIKHLSPTRDVLIQVKQTNQTTHQQKSPRNENNFKMEEFKQTQAHYVHPKRKPVQRINHSSPSLQEESYKKFDISRNSPVSLPSILESNHQFDVYPREFPTGYLNRYKNRQNLVRE